VRSHRSDDEPEVTVPTTEHAQNAVLEPVRGPRLSAIDVLFHPTSRPAKGACPLHPPSEAEMDAARVSAALVAQCDNWSCERNWLCEETKFDDVRQYIESSSRLFGLAGYNPFDITESLRQIELAVGLYDFRGVYVHLAGFGLPLTDARMYPAFAKAAELSVPIVVELPRGCAVESEVERIAGDFPELKIILAQPNPLVADLMLAAAHCENIFFALDAPSLAHVMNQWTALASSRSESSPDFFAEIFEQRCMWGSNGREWSEAVSEPFPLTSTARDAFFQGNANRVFALDQPPYSRKPRSLVTEILAAETD
jgi:predicted TIM-barrel fold metal-dependent hydrolase